MFDLAADFELLVLVALLCHGDADNTYSTILHSMLRFVTAILQLQCLPLLTQASPSTAHCLEAGQDGESMIPCTGQASCVQ